MKSKDNEKITQMLCVLHLNDGVEKKTQLNSAISLTISKDKTLYRAKIWMGFCKVFPCKGEKEKNTNTAATTAQSAKNS